MTKQQKIQTTRIAANKKAAAEFAKKAKAAKHTFFRKQYLAASKRHAAVAARILERRNAAG